MHFTSAVVASLIAFAVAAPIEDTLIARNTVGDCTGPASALTGGVCETTAQATGFMIDGQCVSLKLAGGSLYKHRQGQCHKHINHRRELEARNTVGDCTGPSSDLTGGVCETTAQATGFMIDGQCVSLKLAGGSLYKHRSGKCHKHINHRRELEARSTVGDCTGPSSELTGGTCETTAQATGFMIDGQCVSLKLAGGSLYKHRSGKCHKRINHRREILAARNTVGDCTGPSSALTGGSCETTAQATGFMIDGQCVSLKLAGGSLYKHREGQCHKRINRRELEARNTVGDCTGPSSDLTGGECETAAQATGFMIDGTCVSLKLAGGSQYKHRSGKCHKRINRRELSFFEEEY